MPNGTWQERDVAALVADAGSSSPDVTVARWVPRQDGHVVALVVEPSVGVYDPDSQPFRAVADEARDVIARSSVAYRNLSGGIVALHRGTNPGPR